MLLFYEWRDMNGNVVEQTGLSPIDKIKINEGEVERQREIVSTLKEKLANAESILEKKIDKTNQLKKDARVYLDELKKEIK